MKKHLTIIYCFIILAFLTLTSYTIRTSEKTITTKSCLIFDKNNKLVDSIEIFCDSIYKGKGYKLTLINIDNRISGDTKHNIIFKFYKIENGRHIIIFKDTIYSQVQAVSFVDYNNDNVKDILIQNISDVRSNWTYISI